LKLACALCLVAGVIATGLAQGQPNSEAFSAKTSNMRVGSGQDLKMDVFRWSSDDERNGILTALKDPAGKALADAVQKAPSLGTIWTNESLGYTIRYAYHDTLPAGSERVVLATDRRFGSWSGQPWKPLAPFDAEDQSVWVIELHLSPGGIGEGKMSLTSKIGTDETGKTLALVGYPAAPVLLRNVKKEPGPSK
jgi:hypothetical protein